MWSKYSKHIIFITLISFLIISCEEKKEETAMDSSPEGEIIVQDFRADSLSPGEFIQWYRDEAFHLRKTIETDLLRFTLEFRPTVYSALQEIRKEEISHSELDSAISNYEGLMQFRMEIEIPGSNEEFLKHDSPDGESYENRVKYFAFEMQKDISLVISGDTLPCSMLHFERNYGTSPKSVFLLGFVKTEIGNKADILIHEKIFTGKEIKFSFTKEDLSNLPLLKTL